MYEICNKVLNKAENCGIARKFRVGLTIFFHTEGGWENFAVQGGAEPLGGLEYLGELRSC